MIRDINAIPRERTVIEVIIEGREEQPEVLRKIQYWDKESSEFLAENIIYRKETPKDDDNQGKDV